jgi:hypothetical protein
MTDNEVSGWLMERNLIEDPYHRTSSTRHYLQFRVPVERRRLEEFARQYFERIIPGTTSLLHVTDWAHYTSEEMAAFTAIRSGGGEERDLIEAPGHLIAPAGLDAGVILFSLSVAFGWTAYLYSLPDRTTIYNWEGELLDFWTDSAERFSEMERMVELFELVK